MIPVGMGTQTMKFLILVLLGYVSLIISGCSSYCTSQVDQGNRFFSVPPARGCKVYSPSPVPYRGVPFLGRAQTETESGIAVTVSVLSDEESKKVFGLNLAGEGIQPIWLRIENKTKGFITFLHVALDPGYFSPNEASYVNYSFASPVNEMINEYFNKWGIKRDIPAGGELSGFLYARWDPGVKYVNVSIYGTETDRSFVFYFEIPGIRTDYQRVDWGTLYSEEEIIDYQDEDELRAALEGVPCCATKKDGSGSNDPLNFFIIGNSDDIFSAFISRGWDVTEPIYAGSGWRAFKAFFSGARYRTSPMSSLFFFKRSQDVGFQKARSTIHERNHLRLWLTPMRFRGKEVWVGAVSRDIGSYFTFKTPWLTAHAIDPDVDEARTYLEQDLFFSGGVRKFGYVGGIEPATRENPHRNFMDQPWWTDGLRSVFFFDEESTTLTELQFLDWEWTDENSEEIIKYIRQLNEKRKN